MRTGSLCLTATLCIVLAALGCQAFGAQIVKGAVASVAADGGYLRMETDDGVLVVEPADDVKVMRGQVGKDLRTVKLQDLAPGDRLVAVIDQNGRATSVKGFFGIVKGAFAKVEDDKIVFDDGRSVPVIPETQIVTNEGKSARLTGIAKDSSLTCRVNPITGLAWTVLVAPPVPKTVVAPVKPVVPESQLAEPEPKPTPEQTKPEPQPKADAQAEPEPTTVPVPAAVPARPEIKSLTYSAPRPLKGGDMITVDLTGTPGADAAVEVKNLIERTAMKEISAGVYHATLTVPKNKVVTGAALVGRLEMNGMRAIPVQASRLVSVEAADEPVVTPVKAVNPDEPKPQLAKEKPQSDVLAGTPVAVPNLKPHPVPTQEPQEMAMVKEQAPVKAAPQVVIPTKNIAEQPSKTPSKTADVIITMPADGARIQRSIAVKGKAYPDEKLRVVITYNNGMAGILKLSGEVASQLVAVGKNGEFAVGPFALEGPLATRGLEFTIKAYYPDRADHCTATVKAVGTRS